MRIRINVNIAVNRVVKYFVLSDLFLLAGWGLIDPVFSIFIIQRITGATLVSVGIAAGIYWILRSALQVPIAKYLDRVPGEKDDFHVLVIGLVIAGFSAFLFALVKNVWALYLVQAVRALAFALYGAAWPSIFSRHLDKERVSFDWTVDSVAVGVAAGISGFIGGILADKFGFDAVFILGAALSLLAALALMSVPDLVIPKDTTRESSMQDHRPGNIGV